MPPPQGQSVLGTLASTCLGGLENRTEDSEEPLRTSPLDQAPLLDGHLASHSQPLASPLLSGLG